MVGSIGSSGISASNFQMDFSSRKLTDEQKKTLEEIIGKYDPDNMDAESSKAMMDEIKSAGIGPNREFGEIMNAAGFKPPEKPQGPPPEDMAQGASSKTEIPSFMQDFLQKQEAGNITEEDIYSLIQNLLSNSQSTKGSIIDQKA